MVAVSKQNYQVVDFLLKNKINIEYRQRINESDLFIDKQDIAEYITNMKPKPKKKAETNLEMLADVIETFDKYCSTPEENNVNSEV